MGSKMETQLSNEGVVLQIEHFAHMEGRNAAKAYNVGTVPVCVVGTVVHHKTYTCQG